MTSISVLFDQTYVILSLILHIISAFDRVSLKTMNHLKIHMMQVRVDSDDCHSSILLPPFQGEAWPFVM